MRWREESQDYHFREVVNWTENFREKNMQFREDSSCPMLTEDLQIL